MNQCFNIKNSHGAVNERVSVALTTKVLHNSLEVSEFEFQSNYHVHFRTNTLKKVIELLIKETGPILWKQTKNTGNKRPIFYKTCRKRTIKIVQTSKKWMWLD